MAEDPKVNELMFLSGEADLMVTNARPPSMMMPSMPHLAASLSPFFPERDGEN
jgi:hypothetical protein